MSDPVAWWVKGCEYDTGCEYEFVALLKEQAELAATNGGKAVPLYPHPQAVVAETATATLTDAEREAVEWGIALMKDTGMTKHPAALRGLLERLGTAHEITETTTARAADAAKRDTNQPRKGALRHE